MFTSELWQFFGVIVVPLVGVLVGGVVYMLRKLDDRLYHLAVNAVTRADLLESTRPLSERITRLEGQLQGGQPHPPRWRH